MKGFICTLISAAIAICTCNFSSVTAFGAEDWDGLADISWYNENDSEFTLNTPCQLAGLSKLVNEENESFANKTIYLGADIEFYTNSDADEWSKEKNIPKQSWQPIGILYETPFKGIFDGCGYTISGLYSLEAENIAGLFGFIGSNSEIKNLTLSNSYIYSMNKYSGGICAYNHYADISNCHSSAIICSDYYIAGGIAGVNLGGNIQSCANTGSVAGGVGSGGITGECIHGLLSDCYNSGRSGSATTAGGISGYINSCTINNTYNIGEVSGMSIAGGIAGSVKESSNINNSYNIGKVISENGVSCGIVGEQGAECSSCYYLSSTTDKDNSESSESISDETLKGELASMLGEAFVSGENHPILAWQKKIDNPDVTTTSTSVTTTSSTATTTVSTNTSTTAKTSISSTTAKTTASSSNSSAASTSAKAIKIWSVNNVTELTGIGSTVQLLIDGNSSVPQWATLDKNVAVVDENGLVTATGAGKVIIVATVGGVAVTKELTVKESAVSSTTTTTVTTTTTTATTTTTTMISAYSLGDCDGNRKIDIADATQVLTYYAKNAAGITAAFNKDDKLNMLAFYAADTTRDGSIGIEDATLILRNYSRAAVGLTLDWNIK